MGYIHLGQSTPTPQLRQQGDFVTREYQWCPQLNKIQSNACFPYEPGEIAISHTAAGHVTPDVVLVPSGIPAPTVKIVCQYLIIRDFGVDWRHIKLATVSYTHLTLPTKRIV